MPLTSYGGDGGSDWLQSLLAGFGASQPNAPGLQAGPGPQGLMPGGGALGYQAATPGAPSMGYPAMGQPGAPPAAAQSPPLFQFGGFHPGAIFQQHPPGSATLGPVFNASGSPGGPPAGPGGPGSAGDDGGFNNPYMAAAAANPPQGGPYVGSGAPSLPGPAPAGVGGPYVGGQGATPIDRNNPLPWRASTAGPTPTGSPSATPRPARPVTPTPATAYPNRAASAAPASDRFTLVDRVNAGPLAQPGRGYQTALNLAGLFGGGQQPAGAPANAANPANVPAPAATPVSGQLPGGRYINPQTPGGPPDYGMLPVDITGYPVRGVNAPMFATLRGKKIPNPSGWYGS